MQDQSHPMTQLTFHYLNGHTESFLIPPVEDETQQDLRLEVRHILQKDWWILNLPEQTVMVNVSNVLKVEVNPPLSHVLGEGVFPNAERVTALNRSRM
jgi:hypothetical protein